MARERNKLQAPTRRKLQQIVRLAALEKAPQEIASAMGMSSETVTDLMSTKVYRALEDEYHKRVYAGFDKMLEQRNASQLLAEASPDAAEALVDLLNDVDPVTQRLAATAILDRSGHGPVQRRAVKHRIEIDPATATLLGDAMRGAQTIDVEAIEAEIGVERLNQPANDEQQDNT